ncbi:hypothetical protein FRB90_001842 [Tulasnella sp. 427]|nr:hypothetical protein FRB90_001842 [Tulasnella sp. 427]
MMRFARTRLRGKALRWYATLETSVKGDWDRFVQALFEQYPLDEQPDGADIRTPACSNGSGTVLPGGSEIYPYRGSADRTLPPQDPRPISLNSRGTCSTNETPISARRYDISMSGQQIGLLRIVTTKAAVGTRVVKEQLLIVMKRLWLAFFHHLNLIQWPVWCVRSMIELPELPNDLATLEQRTRTDIRGELLSGIAMTLTLTASVAPPDIVLQGNSGGECEAFVVAIQEYAFATGQDDDPQWMMRFARTRLRGKALRWYAHLDPSMKKDWELFVQAMFDQYPFDEQPMESDVRTSVWSSTTFSPSGSTAALPVDSEINHRVQNTGSSGPLQEAFLSGNPNDLDKSLLRGPALSTRQYSPSSTGQKVGRLRIVYEEETSTLEYVWWNYIAHGIEWIEDSNYERSNRLQTTLNRHEALIVQFLPSSMCHTIGCLNSKTGNKYLAIRYPRSAKSP